ncbi:MAG TPA: hypothetical protein VF768_03585, partial [Holophagaceae bacterium]
MRRTRPVGIPVGRVHALVLACLFVLGCGHGTLPVSEYYGYYHPPTWINDHQAAAAASTAGCRTCHEMSLVKTGSGIPNCLTSACHHQGTPGWAQADFHGDRAKWALGRAGGSLPACQICHGR